MADARKLFEKAFVWKAKKLLGFTPDDSAELCLDAMSRAFVCIAVKDASTWKSARHVKSLDFFRDTLDPDRGLLEVNVEKSLLDKHFTSLDADDLRKRFALVPVSDFEQYGPETADLVFSFLWETASRGELYLAVRP